MENIEDYSLFGFNLGGAVLGLSLSQLFGKLDKNIEDRLKEIFAEFIQSAI